MHKNNCFDTLRHIAALLVIFSHHHVFMGIPERPILGFVSLGGLSVSIFFSISGFLVTQSYLRTGGYIGFMEKRVRRIFPALIVCAFLMVFVLAPFYRDNVLNYITSKEAISTFLRIVFLLPGDITGVFSGYKFIGPMNGTLWTLSIEFMCYILIGAFLSINKSWKTPLTVLLVLCFLNVFLSDAEKTFSWYSINIGWIISFGLCFSLGSLMSMTIESWNHPKTKLLISIVCLSLLYILYGSKEILTVGYLSITFITLAIGVSVKDFIVKGRFDISYGIYIYGWPVQQIVANKINIGFYTSMLLSIVITIILATASWFLIEKPFTRRSSSIGK